MAYTIPYIGNTPHILAGAKYSTKLDLKSGYWQVQLKEEGKPKTAFQVYINKQPFIMFLQIVATIYPLIYHHSVFINQFKF